MTNAEMTYSESAKGVAISRKRAEQEARAHGMSRGGIDEMWHELADAECLICGERVAVHVPDGCGSHGLRIDAGKVLDWLGY